jgi:hypothetical protein
MINKMMHGSYDSKDHDNGITLCGRLKSGYDNSLILSNSPHKRVYKSNLAFFVEWFSHVNCPECIRAAEDRFDIELIIAARMRSLK